MAVGENIAKVAGTVLAIAKTRIELASIELEEERIRILTFLLLSLAAMFCFSLAVLLIVILIIVLCWEVARIPAIIGLTVFFVLAGLVAWFWGLSVFRKRKRLFEMTCQELAKDIDRLKPSA